MQKTADGGYFKALKVMNSKAEVIRRLKVLHPSNWAYYVKGYKTPKDRKCDQLCTYYEFDGKKLIPKG